MSGGGDPLRHFEAASTSSNQCYSTCQDSYRAAHPGVPMRFVNGRAGTTPMRFRGEAQIMQALVTHGPAGPERAARPHISKLSQRQQRNICRHIDREPTDHLCSCVGFAFVFVIKIFS